MDVAGVGAERVQQPRHEARQAPDRAQRRQLLGIPGEVRRALSRDCQLLPRLAVERLALTFADRGVQVLEPLV